MTRLPRGSRPQLSESWASMETSQDDITSVTSDEEYHPRLRETYYNSHKTPNLSSSRVSDETQEYLSHDKETPRKSNAAQITREPEFVMPSPESSEYLGSSPTQQTPKRATRASGATRRSTPNRRAKPNNARAEKRARNTNASSQPGYQPQHQLANYIHLVWSYAVLPLLNYLLSVLSVTANAMKPLFGYGLLVLLLAVGLSIGKTMVVRSVSNALSPICAIPGAGFLNLPFCTVGQDHQQRGPVEFDKLVTTQSNFEDVLHASINQAALPLAMKNSELSIRDLRTVVKHSHLHSRNELVNEFDGFIETARQASDGMSQFNSRISRALDGILSANRWTMKVLQGIESAPDVEGAIPRFISSYLSVFSPLFSVPQQSTETVLYEQYVRHTSEVEEQIQVCILEANTLLEVLDNLHQRLSQIHDIAHREGIKVEESKDELLGVLWTKLGANRGALAKHERQLKTLEDVTTYRNTAVQHVTVTLMKLKDIESNLGQLRDDVGAPKLVGQEKLPLEMHIDLISSAVDRLQAVRDEGRREKESMLRDTLDQINRVSDDKRKRID